MPRTRSRATESKISKEKTEKTSSILEALPAKEEANSTPITTLSVRTSSAVADELEPYEFDGRDASGKLLDNNTQKLLRESALTIKRALRTQVTSVVIIGRELIKVKKAIKDRTYMRWFEVTLSEFFSLDTAENYANAARLSEQYSLAELESMPLNALYVLGRSTVEKELQSYVIQELAPAAQEEGNPLSKKDIQRVIKNYRQIQLNNSSIDAKVRPMLVAFPIAEDREELQRLGKLSVKRQLEVVQILKENPKVDVKQALTIIRENTQEPADDLLEAEIVSVTNQLETRRGDWFSLLQKTESESVDLCFAEMPLNKEALKDYQLLAQEVDRILKPGGMLLSVVSQSNVQFVGNYLEPLHVLWTFMLMRRPGHSPRIVGRISFASSYIPLSLAYKSPLRAIPGLVDDVRTGIPDDIMQFHFRAAAEDNSVKEEETFSLSSLESSIEYYVKSLMQSGDVFMHLVHNPDASFRINDHLYNYVFGQAQASKVISLIGT